MNRILLPSKSITCRCHVLRSLKGLKPDEGNLHRAKKSEDEEGVVGHVDAVGVAVHQD